MRPSDDTPPTPAGLPFPHDIVVWGGMGLVGLGDAVVLADNHRLIGAAITLAMAIFGLLVAWGAVEHRRSQTSRSR